MGQTTLGTYVIYGGLAILLLVVGFTLLRIAMMLSLLLLSPGSTVLSAARRVLRLQPRSPDRQ